jgi:F-type H+-transporting ATPase subunit epsilon
MISFRLHLQSATQYERINDVITFVGEDDSGSFGIMAGHERMMTALRFGLARFRTIADEWRYIALPGGLLYFVENELFVNTRRYVLDEDWERIAQTLDDQLRREEEALGRLKESLHRLEEEMFKRLWNLSRGREPHS